MLQKDDVVDPFVYTNNDIWMGMKQFNEYIYL